MAVVGNNYAVLERGRLHTGGFLTWLVRFPATVAEPPARPTPMAVVIFHWPAQLASDPRAAAGLRASMNGLSWSMDRQPTGSFKRFQCSGVRDGSAES